ncbi:MAG: copper ion binding protein [Deltaproteobacteria bacterium]|nr:copper ion binding protein [Deltaproteobacteria bacterium]
MEEKTVHVPAISCGHCVHTIKQEIGELEGVSAVDGSEETKDVNVKWDAPATWEKIAETLKEIGYPAE